MARQRAKKKPHTPKSKRRRKNPASNLSNVVLEKLAYQAMGQAMGSVIGEILYNVNHPNKASKSKPHPLDCMCGGTMCSESYGPSGKVN